MILLTALFASQLAAGCRRLERSVLCELAPPIRAAPPSPSPRTSVAAETAPPHRRHRPPADRTARAPATPPTPPTADEIARHVESLVSIADCTGARTLLISAGHTATADSTYLACIGPPTVAAEHDLASGAGRTATARPGDGGVEHPR